MKNYLLVAMLAVPMLVVGQNSPYINKVYEYRPAPGQFINLVPEWETGDTKEDMILRVEEYLVNNERSMVSLGAWGGFIVFGFDHPVVNVPGQNDFKVLGNALLYNESGTGQKSGGSSEPGIVYVSYDANGNGLPDDAWYELAGSEYNNPATVHDYQITYYKPTADHVAVPDPDYKYIIDSKYIRWKDNNNGEGYVTKNSFHLQNYWPEWLSETELSFEGAKLPGNYQKLDGGLYLQYPYAWGYADNAPDSNEAAELNIEWAVDKDGNAVDLQEIHFVKVQTGVNQDCGWLGESSTEIMGAVDLHPNATSIRTPQSEAVSFSYDRQTKHLQVTAQDQQEAAIYSIAGVKIKSFTLYIGHNYIPCESLSAGVYLLRTPRESFKFIR